MVEFDLDGYYYIDDESTEPLDEDRVDLYRIDIVAGDVTANVNEENGYTTYTRTSSGQVLIAENLS